jgi:hypothetical protein
MLTQTEIIGPHPSNPSIFEKWLNSNDIARVAGRCHRSLSGKVPSDNADLIDWLAGKIIEHHYSLEKLKRLKKKYKEIGFPAYAKKHRQIPKADRTMKGNAAEIILIEYICECQPAGNLVKYYKFRYNPNVDQSMKGDDALIVDIINGGAGTKNIKVILGEAKFRATPAKEVVTDLSKAISKDKLPLSYTFMIDRLYESPDTEDIAELLDEFVMEEVKAKGNMKYAGLLLSNVKASTYVENNFSTDNAQAVIISIGIDDPKQLIYQAFKKAQDLLDNPTKL